MPRTAKEKVEGYQATIDALNQRLEQLSMEKAQLQSYNSLLQKVARNQQDQGAGMAALVPSPAQADPHAKLTAVYAQLVSFLKLRRPNVPYTAHSIKNMPASEWQQIVPELHVLLGRCLIDGGHVVGSPAHERLVELVNGMHQTLLGMAEVHPKLWRQVELGMKRMGPCSSETWRRVLEAMRLTPAQKAHLVDSRQRLLQSMQDVVNQRKQIAAVLQVAVPGMDGDTTNASIFVQASDAASELQGSLDDEHRAVITFIRDYYCSESSHLSKKPGARWRPAPTA
ncbi:hypothetical protein WJX72_002202 [[Myrmecia] bisecta]|uniref:Uncharacterized protein n=1 Tax=[Myrmecia] bisecta TaxID=41462 RepID=A0AAW1Q789_9CHLO